MYLKAAYLIFNEAYGVYKVKNAFIPFQPAQVQQSRCLLRLTVIYRVVIYIGIYIYPVEQYHIPVRVLARVQAAVKVFPAFALAYYPVRYPHLSALHTSGKLLRCQLYLLLGRNMGQILP